MYFRCAYCKRDDIVLYNGVCGFCKEGSIMKSLKHENWYCCWTNELERDAMCKALEGRGFNVCFSNSDYDCFIWDYHEDTGSDISMWNDRFAQDRKGMKRITVSEFWQRLATDDDYQTEPKDKLIDLPCKKMSLESLKQIIKENE